MFTPDAKIVEFDAMFGVYVATVETYATTPHDITALGLTVGLLGFGVSGIRELGLSALATRPVFIGMSLGRRVRIALDERQFAAGAQFLGRSGVGE